MAGTNQAADVRSAAWLTRKPEPYKRVNWLAAVWLASTGSALGRLGHPLVPYADLGYGDDLAGLPTAPTRDSILPPELTTDVISRQVEAFREHDRKDALAAQAAVTREIHQLRELRLIRAAQLRLRELAEAERVRLAARPPLTADDVTPGPAEVNATKATILGRQQGKQDAALTAQSARVAAIDEVIADLDKTVARLDGGIRSVYHAAVTRSERTRAHWERRIYIHRAAIVHNHPAGAVLQRLMGDSSSIPVPEWTKECTWIPQELSIETPDVGEKEIDNV